MIKNLGKFKQWTGERFGGAKVTLQTEDFQRLEQETEHRREGYDRILDTVNMIQNYLLKRKISPEDNRNKVMPFEALGSCLYHYGTVFPDDSALGIALINLGQTETRIAALQEVLANDIKQGYMSTLENGLQEYKDYDYLKKKLTSRRLDYDSKLNRLNKAKKEKPELEQEMQAARIKYEDTEHDLIQKMAYIQEFENEHRDALYKLVEAQCNYHNQAKELLESIKRNWGQGATSDPRDMMGTVMARRLSNDISHLNSNYTNSSIALQRPSPQSSTDDYQNDSSTAISDQVKCRKALFDFSSENVDEISFKAGDVIAVMDEIDKGWWLGELQGKRGIFPVNYTEEYDVQKQPLPPLPAEEATLEHLEQQETHSSNSSSSSSEFVQQQVAASEQPLHSDDIISSSPPIVTSTTTTTTQKTTSGSLDRKRSVAIRPPPPPPPSATTISSQYPTPIVDEPSSYHDYDHQRNNHQRNTSSSSLFRDPPPALPSAFSGMADQGSESNNSSDNHHCRTALVAAAAVTKYLPCGDCECMEYIENLFKKGYCNYCFHKHE